MSLAQDGYLAKVICHFEEKLLRGGPSAFPKLFFSDVQQPSKEKMFEAQSKVMWERR